MNIDEITYKDRSEFLRGFATIIRKNNCNNIDEKSMFLFIGKSFGFEKNFCEKSLEHLMVNKYIPEEPAIFSTKHIAEYFIKDVSTIMSQTQSISEAAVTWLQLTANANKVDFEI